MLELEIQETDKKQRLARMVGLLQSIQLSGITASKQDVLFRTPNFTKIWGVFS
jgi:hypothetical protein